MAEEGVGGIEQAVAVRPAHPPPLVEDRNPILDQGGPLDKEEEEEEGATEDDRGSRDPSPYGGHTLKYYDVMIVGITGQGKSTTSDKMVIASPQAGQQPSTTEEDVQREEKEEAEQEIRDGKMTVKDLSFWTVSDIPKEKEGSVKEYLKSLDFFRDLDSPHARVNEAREEAGDINPVTSSCQLVSNERTGMRVLDVPGFFSVGGPPRDHKGPAGGRGREDEWEGVYRSQPSQRLETDINRCTRKHLAVMRDILRIQTSMGMRFSRILYFLPVRGPLERASGVLLQELLLLARYFGRAVFECMVLVATAQTRLSRIPALQGQLFTEWEARDTGEQFQRALRQVLPGCPEAALPRPPVVFVSMLDDCEDIVAKVRGARVEKERLELTFERGLCIKCCSTIKWLEDEKVECVPVGGVAGGMAEEEEENHCEVPAVPYSESHCHPVFLPKNAELERVELESDGSAYLVIHTPTTRERGRGQPEGSAQEVCLNCERSPGEVGCMKVGEMFPLRGRDGKTVEVKVDHTNQLERHKVLLQSGGDEEGEESGAESESGGDSPQAYEASDSGGYTSELVVPEGGVMGSSRQVRRRREDREYVGGRPGQTLLKEASEGGAGGDRKG